MCIIHTVNNFEDAKKLIDENPNCIILDVREEEEYATGHVKDAVLFPVDDITVESAKEVIPSKDSMLVVYLQNRQSQQNGGRNSLQTRLHRYL